MIEICGRQMIFGQKSTIFMRIRFGAGLRLHRPIGIGAVTELGKRAMIARIAPYGSTMIHWLKRFRKQRHGRQAAMAPGYANNVMSNLCEQKF